MKDKQISISKANLILGVFFIIFGGTFLYLSLNISDTGNNLVGPAAFPFIISFGILVSGVFLIGLRNKETQIIEFNNIGTLLKFLIALIVYLILISNFGYYISSIFIFPILLIIGGVRKLLSIILYSMLFILVAFIFFDLLLGIPLPGGIIE